MIMWMIVCAVIGGMAVVLGGVLSIAGDQTRQEEEAAVQASLERVDLPAA